MSVLTDNVIPGNHGKVFGTNAKNEGDLDKIKEAILKVHGVKDMFFEKDKYPVEFTIHTSTLVKIKAIEQAAISAGFHAIPKNLFEL